MSSEPYEEVVAEGVVVLVNGDGGAGQANSTVLASGRDATVVDTMLLPWMADAIHGALQQRRLTPRLVVTTHQHADHFGGNVTFADVPMVASARTAATIAAAPKDYSFLRGLFPRFADEVADFRLAAPQPRDGTETGLPAGAQFLTFEHAHTPGDLAVWLPEQSVLVAGDLSFHGVTPLTFHSSIDGWIAALDSALALRPAVVVPGHGPPGDHNQLLALRHYLARLVDVAADAVRRGVEPDPDDVAVAGWREPERNALNLRVATQQVRSSAPA